MFSVPDSICVHRFTNLVPFVKLGGGGVMVWSFSLVQVPGWLTIVERLIFLWHV